MKTAHNPRNHVIDLARAAAILVVVLFHSLLYQVRLVHGAPTFIPWAPDKIWWLLSWFFMIIPVFFIAGGFAHALIVDRMNREHSGYGHFLANRGRRLVGPLVLFVTVASLVSSVSAWTGDLADAVSLSKAIMQLLWFITVYLVIVLIAPAAVAAHDRWGWRPIAVLALLAAGVDAWSFAVGDYQWRNLNMLTVWPLAHQLGIAYHRGWFRRGPRWQPIVAIVVGGAGIAALVLGLHYPGSAVGFADIPIANVQPPTSAMGFLAIAQCGVLGLVERSGKLARIGPRFEKLLALVNALMMSVYLWHIPCIGLAAGGLLALSMAVPALAGIALSQVTVALVTLTLVTLVVPQIGRLEYRLIPPLGEHQNAAGAFMAFVVLIVGTSLVWQSGTVLHPGAPASMAGVVLVWFGAWMMAHAANSAPQPDTQPRPLS